jgi:hypothetical protein
MFYIPHACRLQHAAEISSIDMHQRYYSAIVCCVGRYHFTHTCTLPMPPIVPWAHTCARQMYVLRVRLYVCMREHACKSQCMRHGLQMRVRVNMHLSV